MQPPPEVLTISYRDLGDTPNERLKLVAILGVLLHRPPSFYTPQALGLTPQNWILLHNWATGNGDPQVVVAHGQGVTIRRDTSDHVLVGIDRLINDLRHVLEADSVQSDPGRLWAAVRRLVEREVAQ